MSAGTLQAVALIVHGTRTVPLHLKKEKRYADEELVASALDSAEVRKSAGAGKSPKRFLFRRRSTKKKTCMDRTP